MVRCTLGQGKEEDHPRTDHHNPVSQAQDVLLPGVERLYYCLQKVSTGSTERLRKVTNKTRHKLFPSLYRYASLYFCCAIEQNDNELLTLEVIHRYVELLDKYFGSVSSCFQRFKRFTVPHTVQHYFTHVIHNRCFRCVNWTSFSTSRRPISYWTSCLWEVKYRKRRKRMSSRQQRRKMCYKRSVHPMILTIYKLTHTVGETLLVMSSNRDPCHHHVTEATANHRHKPNRCLTFVKKKTNNLIKLSIIALRRLPLIIAPFATCTC